MITIDLNKEQALDADPEAIQQVNFTGNLDDWWGKTAMHFVIEEAKETIWDFSQETVWVLSFYFILI